MEARDVLLKGQAGHGNLMTEFAKTQRGEKFSTKKMYTYLMSAFPRKRLATIERLEKFGIQVPPNCVFCGTTKETFDHLYFGSQRSQVAWISAIAKKTIQGAEIATSVFVMIVYIIWRERNQIIFQQESLCAYNEGDCNAYSSQRTTQDKAETSTSDS
ncbi:hypothetical protein KY285_036094 [Solanum tuberosum]|nr:hypothetical protein KY285_036094 [Solanum tuberosum]